MVEKSIATPTDTDAPEGAGAESADIQAQIDSYRVDPADLSIKDLQGNYDSILGLLDVVKSELDLATTQPKPKAQKPKAQPQTAPPPATKPRKPDKFYHLTSFDRGCIYIWLGLASGILLGVLAESNDTMAVLPIVLIVAAFALIVVALSVRRIPE